MPPPNDPADFFPPVVIERRLSDYRKLNLPDNSSMGQDESGVFIQLNGKRMYLDSSYQYPVEDYLTFMIATNIDGKPARFDAAKLFELQINFEGTALENSLIVALELISKDLKAQLKAEMGIDFDFDVSTQEGLAKSCIQCHGSRTEFIDEQKIHYIKKKFEQYLEGYIIKVEIQNIRLEMMDTAIKMFQDQTSKNPKNKEVPQEDQKDKLEKHLDPSKQIQAINNKPYSGNKCAPHVLAQRNRGNNRRRG